jgi:hypothetical protein
VCMYLYSLKEREMKLKITRSNKITFMKELELFLIIHDHVYFKYCSY